MTLNGKVAWITGAGSGIGLAGAKSLADAGATVILSGRRKEVLGPEAEKLRIRGFNAEVEVLDVSDKKAVKKAVTRIVSRHGGIDILVNSAGLNVPNRYWKNQTLEGWDDVIGINLDGSFYTTYLVLPGMRARKDGVIINISSWSGVYHVKLTGAAYNASKHAVIAMTETINMEECVNGIRACAICPAEVSTPIMDKRPVPPSAEARAKMLQPEDLGVAIRFVAELPPRACINQLIISPTWNRIFTGELKFPEADRTAMHAVLFVNVRVFDASGTAAFSGEVRVEGERITAVAAADRPLVRDGAEVVDGAGALLMPGLVESHAHLSFTDFAQSVEMGFIPPEEHVLATAGNARKLLDAGFTSCFSAASAKPRLDIVVRDAIERGDLPGPRLRAASPEMTVTAGLGDVRLSHLYRENFAKVCDGADEFRRFAREMVREGVDVLKINVSGDSGARSSPAESTVMTDAEVAAVCEVARAHAKRVAAHARSAESVKMALRHGVEVIYHATLLDEEAKDLLEAAKQRMFVAPVLGHLYTTLYEATPWGLTVESGRERGLQYELEAGIENMKDLKKRGVRILPGGDYGFAWNPNGSNARDIEHFVNLLGFSPIDALVAATRLGGEIMGLGESLGQIKPGYLADLLLVDGDPLADPSVLRNRNRFRAIMKGGRFHLRRG